MVMFNDVGRNDPCPCGSGKKYKKCCLQNDEAKRNAETPVFLDADSKEKLIRSAQSCPVERCLITQDWQKKGMANIIVVRRQADDRFMLGVYLVDLFCLGVKNALCNAGMTDSTLEEFLENVMMRDSFEKIDLEYAKEIVFGGIEYARNLGFEPHADFKLAREVLGTDAITRNHKVRFGGPDGKPLFISGPDDDADAILAKLLKR